MQCPSEGWLNWRVRRWRSAFGMLESEIFEAVQWVGQGESLEGMRAVNWEVKVFRTYRGNWKRHYIFRILREMTLILVLMPRYYLHVSVWNLLTFITTLLFPALR